MISQLTVKGSLKSFMMYGGYRALIERPKYMEHKMGQFENWGDDVLSFDAEEDLYMIEKGPGSNSFLVIQFTLSKGSYATMLLRELFHNPTDKDIQIDLTSYLNKVTS